MKEKATRLINLIPVISIICMAVPVVLISLDGLGLPLYGVLLPAATAFSVLFGYFLQHITARILGLKVERYGFVGRNKGRIEKFRVAFAPIPILILVILSVMLSFGFTELFQVLWKANVIERLNNDYLYPFTAALLFFICGFLGVVVWFYPLERLSNISFVHISSVIFLVEIAGAAIAPSREEIMGDVGVCFFVFAFCLMVILNQTNLQRTHLGTIVADVSPSVRNYNLFLVFLLLLCTTAVLGVTYVIIRGLYIIGSFLVFLVLYKIFYWGEVQRYQQVYDYPTPEESAEDFTKVLLENGGNTIVPLFIMIATIIVLLIIGAKTGVLQKLVAYLKEVIREFFFTIKLGRQLLSETDLYDVGMNGNYKDEKKKLQDAMIREYMDLASSTDKYELFLRRLAKLPDSAAQLSFAYAMLVTVLRKECAALTLSDTPREIQRKVKHLVPEKDMLIITQVFEWIKYGEKDLDPAETSRILDGMCGLIKRYIF